MTDYQGGVRVAGRVVARWVASTHHFTPSHTSIVIRARPDCIFPSAFELGALSDFFERSSIGSHLVLSQEPVKVNAQGDTLLITSWRCYENDIAVLLGMPSRVHIGVARGWGVLPTLSDRMSSPCECIEEPSESHSEGRVLAASACDTPSCDTLVVESPFILRNDVGLMRFIPRASPRLNLVDRIDLARNVHCYCPSWIVEPLMVDSTIKLPRLERLAKPWLVSEGDHYYRCMDGTSLNANTTIGVWCLPHPKLPLLASQVRANRSRDLTHVALVRGRRYGSTREE